MMQDVRDYSLRYIMMTLIRVTYSHSDLMLCFYYSVDINRTSWQGSKESLFSQNVDLFHSVPSTRLLLLRLLFRVLFILMSGLIRIEFFNSDFIGLRNQSRRDDMTAI